MLLVARYKISKLKLIKVTENLNVSPAKPEIQLAEQKGSLQSRQKFRMQIRKIKRSFLEIQDTDKW